MEDSGTRSRWRRLGEASAQIRWPTRDVRILDRSAMSGVDGASGVTEGCDEMVR
jgi:hypothetical protein